jgi:hypothetical protein
MITVIYFWRIKRIYLPLAILNMATNKFLLKIMLGKSFIKMLGTGKGESFTPKDADSFRWGILITTKESNIKKFDSSFVIKLWQKIARSQYRTVLRPI